MRDEAKKLGGEIERIEKITLIFLRVVFVVALSSIAYQFVFQISNDQISVVEMIVMPTALAGFSGVLVMLFFAGYQHFHSISLFICISATLYMAVMYWSSLFVLNDPLVGLRYAAWFAAPYVLAIATQSTRVSQIYCWSSIVLIGAISAAHIVHAGLDLREDMEAVLIMHVVLGQVGVALLLFALSIYRDAHFKSQAHVEAVQETADQLQQAIHQADEARLEAEVANDARARFLATVSHELRTPLNAIIGFSDILSDGLYGPHSDARYGEYAKDINASGHYLLQLINQILDFTKIDSGQIDLDPSRFEIGRAVDEVVRLIDVGAVQAGVDLEVDLPDPSLALVADRRALSQILVNLLSNAVKFTEPGGRVSLSIAAEADGPVLITVRDTGVGIPAEQLESVLEPFVRLENPTTATASGTGLGLPIVKSLIDGHGGKLEIDSTVGEGTTVTVRLPRHELPAEAPAV